MELRQAIPKPVTLWKFIVQFVAVITFCSPFFWWGWYKLEAQAQEYVEEIIAPSISELTTKIDELAEQVGAQTESLSEVTEGQSAEATQSGDEAQVNRQILCLLQKLDPDSEPAEDCDTIE